MSLLVSFFTYGLLVLGARQLMKTDGPVRVNGQMAPTSVPVILVDFSHLKESVPEPPPEAQAPKEDQGNAGGGGSPQVATDAVQPEAIRMDAASAVFDEDPLGLPTAPLSPSPAVGHGSGTGTGGGNGSGRGTGTGAGEGEGFKAALPLSSEDVEVEERFKPEYPFMAEIRRIEGWVHVRLEVNDKGVPTRVWIVDGDPVFHSNVISTFKRYRFKNLKARGIPTPAIIEIPVWFHFPRN